MARIVVAVATFALGAHAIAAPVLGAENYDGTYTGKQMLTKGSNAEACLTEEEDVSLIIRGEVLRFTNSRRHDFP